MINYYVIPYNVKHYDIINHFNSDHFILIKTDKLMVNGDIVFFYIASPYKEIMFQGVVIDDKPSKELVIQSEYVYDSLSFNYKYVLIKMTHTFKNGMLSISKIKELGVNQVLKQSRADRKLIEYIENNKEIMYAN